MPVFAATLAAVLLFLHACSSLSQGPVLTACLPLLLLVFVSGSLIGFIHHLGVKRLAVASATGLAVLLLLGAIAGVEVSAARLQAGAGTALIFLAHSAGGLWLLEKWLGKENRLGWAERLLLGAGVGRIVTLTLVLLAGSAGCLSPWAFGAMGAAAFALGSRSWWSNCSCGLSKAGHWVDSLSPVGVTAFFLFLFFLPILGLAGFFPPLDYDVLEYHLQLPKEYMDVGMIRHFAHNTFSGLPQGTEMLSLLSFVMAGGSYAEPVTAAWGLWMARLIHVTDLLLLFGALVLAARRLGADWNGALLAGMAVFGLLETWSLGFKLYTETAMAAFSVMGLLALMAALEEDEHPPNFRHIGLAGFLAGGAAACKYQGILFTCFGLFLVVLFLPPRRRAGRMFAALLFGLCSWAVLLPWLIKNACWTGNPFYPLWNSAFGVEGWSAVQEARFVIEHSAARHGGFGFQQGLQQAERFVTGGYSLLPLLFLPALLCLGAPRQRRWCGAFIAVVLVSFLAWYGLTNRATRFLYPTHVFLCVGTGVGWSLLRQKGGAIRGVALALGQALLLAISVNGLSASISNLMMPFGPSGQEQHAGEVVLGQVPPEALLKAVHPNWRLREAMQSLPEGSRVLLVGTAEPFWLPSNVEYAVVFANHPLWLALEKDSALLQSTLQQKGITHLYFDWPELARLQGTYHKAYVLTEQKQRALQRLLTRRARRVHLPSWPLWRRSAVRNGTSYTARLFQTHPHLLDARTVVGSGPYELYALNR